MFLTLLFLSCIAVVSAFKFSESCPILVQGLSNEFPDYLNAEVGVSGSRLSKCAKCLRSSQGVPIDPSLAPNPYFTQVYSPDSDGLKKQNIDLNVFVAAGGIFNGDLTTGDGDDCIYIAGVVNGNVNTGRGDDCIFLGGSSFMGVGYNQESLPVENIASGGPNSLTSYVQGVIYTGEGNDVVHVLNAAASGIFTGDGRDFVQIDGTVSDYPLVFNQLMVGDVSTGDGDDIVLVGCNANINSIETNQGDDVVTSYCAATLNLITNPFGPTSVFNPNVAEIESGSGSDRIYLQNIHVGSIDSGSGHRDIIAVSFSEISGVLDVSDCEHDCFIHVFDVVSTSDMKGGDHGHICMDSLFENLISGSLFGNHITVCSASSVYGIKGRHCETDQSGNNVNILNNKCKFTEAVDCSS